MKTMENIFGELGTLGIIPVVTIAHPEDAVPLAKALVEGGIPGAEITFRTDAAKEALSQITKADSSMLVGAGTVRSVEQVKEAVDRGARFIVSPGLNRKVVEYCIEKKIPVIPGVATPTEVEQAAEFGLEILKFFPAEANGGVAYLHALSAPFKNVKFIPTGGIDEKNLLSYLKLPKVLACGGSWMVKADLLEKKKFDEIRSLTSRAVALMLGFELKHVGVNCNTAGDAQQSAARLAGLLNVPVREGDSSVFVNEQVEFLKSKYLGTHGHMAIGTNSVERAVAFLARKGVKIKPETKVEKNGQLRTVYLDVELEGFAVHLLQL
ncbi:MAG: bifunctional 4-hydroxy-2-oxoglutarate aldolase/2-dehydro-3-deoxy-phosphogluconate aldolase [Bacteroidota bacterium]